MEEATADYFVEKMYKKCVKSVMPIDRDMDKIDQQALSNCFVRYVDSFRIVSSTFAKENEKK